MTADTSDVAKLAAEMRALTQDCAAKCYVYALLDCGAVFRLLDAFDARGREIAEYEKGARAAALAHAHLVERLEKANARADKAEREKERLAAELETVQRERDDARDSAKSWAYCANQQQFPTVVDPNRQAIVAAVEEWVNRARDGESTVDEIAGAVIQAAVNAGWVREPDEALRATEARATAAETAFTTARETIGRLCEALRESASILLNIAGDSNSTEAVECARRARALADAKEARADG